MEANTKIKVVIVDDYALVRDGMKILLSACDDISVVGEAIDGRQALTMVRDLKPDVVVTDISMPGMDGISAIESVIAEHPRAKVLVVSSYLSSEMVDRALEAGATGCILKDYIFAELADAIRAVNSRQEYLCTSF